MAFVTSDSPRSARTVTCPACKGPSLFHPDNRWRPFCSQRCRTLDLGAWASESYRVASEAPEPSSDAPPDSDRQTH
ncbi:MAG: DNA gyrase inhibitor YacG [Rubrivivax sp.]|nr:DNA gyrase inhibitor YacG [Rubrivivax sp.]